MKNRKSSPKIRLIALFISGLLLPSLASGATVVYSDDFNGNDFVNPLASGLSLTLSSNARIGILPSGISVLKSISSLSGNRGSFTGFGNENLTITWSGISSFSTGNISFDFIAVGSWDGNNANGPEPVNAFINIVPVLSNATFSNTNGASQNFCPETNSPCPLLTGSIATNSTGFSAIGDRSDVTYRMSFDFDSSFISRSDFSFMIFASNLNVEPGLGSIQLDEGWVIDNLSLSLDNFTSIPEPSSTLILGIVFSLALVQRNKSGR